MKKYIWIVAVTCLTLFQGCAAPTTQPAQEEPSSYHSINAEKAKEMMEEGKGIIVDVRTTEEYQEQHIPNAISLPKETIREEAALHLPNKDAVLLVYCRSGVRSKQASDILVEMGYTQVYDFGGIKDWPYETIAGGANA